MKHAWCFGCPTVDENTARVVSLAGNPALHIPEPLSTAETVTCLSHMLLSVQSSERQSYKLELTVIWSPCSSTTKSAARVEEISQSFLRNNLLFLFLTEVIRGLRGCQKDLLWRWFFRSNRWSLRQLVALSQHIEQNDWQCSLIKHSSPPALKLSAQNFALFQQLTGILPEYTHWKMRINIASPKLMQQRFDESPLSHYGALQLCCIPTDSLNVQKTPAVPLLLSKSVWYPNTFEPFHLLRPHSTSCFLKFIPASDALSCRCPFPLILHSNSISLLKLS